MSEPETVSSEDGIPSGMCQCGCGYAATIAKRTHTSKGAIKGQATRYLPGHATRKGPARINGLKRCSDCGEPKEDSEFHKRARNTDGLRNTCRTCMKSQKKGWHARNQEQVKSSMKRYFLGVLYGTTPEEFSELLRLQGGLCAICKSAETRKHRSGGLVSLSVDHNHTTGKIRGLLCAACNRAIGLMKDDPNRLRAAAAYLEER